MNFRQATKLQLEDSVTDKETGEVVRIILTKVIDRKRALAFKLKRPTVFIQTVNANGGWQEFMHTEVSP